MAKGEDQRSANGDYSAFMPFKPTLSYSAELHEAHESHMGHVLFTWNAKIHFKLTLHRLIPPMSLQNLKQNILYKFNKIWF